MELETLRSIWKEQDAPPETETSPEALLALLKERSRGPIGRMRRNLRKEVILMLVAYIPCILFYWRAFSGRMAAVAWIFAGILLFFYAYYYRKNALLKKMQCMSCEVRSNLAGQLATLQKYVRFYFWSSTIIIPVSIFFSFLIALRAELAMHRHLSWNRAVYGLLFVTLFLTALVYRLNKWQINKLYGRHIRKLQGLLREMDED
jgi:hypothetical protein